MSTRNTKPSSVVSSSRRTSRRAGASSRAAPSLFGCRKTRSTSEETLSSRPPSLPMPTTTSSGAPSQASAASSTASASSLIVPQTSSSGACATRSRAITRRNTRVRSRRSRRLNAPSASPAAPASATLISARVTGCGAASSAASSGRAFSTRAAKRERAARSIACDIADQNASLRVNSNMQRLRRTLEVVAWAAFFALAAAVLLLRYVVLPHIERLRPELVERVSAIVGQPVKIGGIEAQWLGLRPQVNLTDLRIYDAEGREALVLPSVENILSWHSLARGRLALYALHIEGPRLVVRR